MASVMVPNEASGIDHRRITIEGEQFRQHSISVDNSVCGGARLLTGRERPYQVTADNGLASPSVKIEDADTALIGHILKSFPDALAADMEGSVSIAG